MTPVEAAQTLADEGFTGWQIVTFGAIGQAESGLDPYALHRVIKPGTPAHLSIDHGWLQINDYWQRLLLMNIPTRPPYQSVAQYLADPHNCAAIARAMFHNAGGAPAVYELWNTYTSGAYKPYLPAARVAARTIGINV